MKRTFTDAEFETFVVFRSLFFSLSNIETKSGPRDVVCRNNRQTDACKVLPLFLSKKQAASFKLTGEVRLSKLAKEIKVLNRSPMVNLLANDRPITYLKNSGVSKNYVYEYPGGIVEYGEEIVLGGVREMREELGLKKKQVLCFASLLPRSCIDQGTHAEWTSVIVAVCVGKTKPPKSEGIIPKKCRKIPLDEIPKFVEKLMRKEIGFESHILSAYNALKLASL